MAKRIIIVLLILTSIKVNSQNRLENYEIGYVFDIDNLLIDGYFDIDYEPTKSIKVSYTIGEDFTPGCYYDSSNNKITGLLKYSHSNTYFKFKINGSLTEKTIYPEECNGYVIGADTFTVIQNFAIQRDLGGFQSNKKEFAEVVEEFDNITFYKHTRVGVNNIVTTYLYKFKGTKEYIGFPKSYDKYNLASLKVFGEINFISKEYDEGDILTRIKLLKYKKKFENNEKIYFNSSWDEVDNISESSYYAIIKSIEKSVFHLMFFFNDNTPIYEGYFTSFFPHKKVKEFTWYYPKGTVRKKITYSDNKPQKTTTYFRNGKIHSELTHKYPETGNSKVIIYSKLLSPEGKTLLDSLGNGTELYYDSITNKQITIEYKHKTINKAYYFDSTNRKIYLLCKKNAKLKEFRILQLNLSNEKIFPITSINKNNHGFALLKCKIEPNGITSNYEFIKSIDNETNTAIINYLKSKRAFDNWKPAKDGKENVAQEIIIPIDFSIESFSRYRNNYNNFWMMQNQMMMQQMHVQPKIQAPSFR